MKRKDLKSSSRLYRVEKLHLDGSWFSVMSRDWNTKAEAHNAIDLVVEELRNRRLQTLEAGRRVIDLDPGQAACAVPARVVGVLVKLLARQPGGARHPQRGHARPRVRPNACYG